MLNVKLLRYGFSKFTMVHGLSLAISAYDTL